MHKSKRNPSFSSTLLDEIYNSIDLKSQKNQSFVGSVNTSTKKQSIVSRSVPDRKIHRDRFFGSVSSSSDSNSSIFSSSDTELTHGKKVTSSSRPLCFGPSKTKPRKTEDKTLYHQNRATRVYDDYDYTSDVRRFTRHDENWEHSRTRRPVKSSSGNLKKPKTPASPAGRIVNFINSLFSNNNSKQSNAVKSYPRKTSYDDSAFVRKTSNDYHSSTTTCSSASSFSRSCMNKSYEKSSDRIKRSVRFSPVNVIVPESFTNKEEDYFSNVRKSVKKNVEDGGRRSVEEIAREFLRDYHKNHENSLVKNNNFEDYEDDDDVASDSSSDLFELDLVGNHHHHNVYGDELPVYETTFAGLIL
ncbi:PREDICTED: protein BIG GRAIN 1-like D [Camelina sativa]|uniref:Protein BIG GRAIN 1-like D n=1 Tax=Camelina sativa TaxID=90675 RepID=A0ABM0T251_CAMSA|nr:PREDICTED: protein BIG GRAIN 1-like D [Camelina sativa]